MSVLKDQKRGTWLFRTYVEDKYGNLKQKSRSGFKTKGEAKLVEQQFIKDSKKDYTLLSFHDLYKEFVKHKSQNLKPQSIRSIKSRFENHILPFFKDYKIHKIDQKVYLDWKDHIINKHFGYKYNSSLHGAVVSILNYAMDFYNLEKNIASKVGNFSKQEYIKKVDFWTYAEFNVFINNVDDDLYKTLYITLYNTGLRLGECLALNWLDLENGYLKVNKTLAKEKRNNDYIFTTPKTKQSNRQIKLDNTTLKLLDDLKKHYQNYIGFEEKWFIFGGLVPLSQSTVGRRKKGYCVKANVKEIKIHDLRHSHATLLLSKGIPVTVISKRLGHSDMTMTLNTYSHLIPEDENKAVDLLNNLEKNLL